MATVGEVRKAWTVAKAAVGGMKAINGGVRILPDALEVWGRGEVVRVAVGLGVGPVTVSGDTFAALVKLGRPSDDVAVEVDYPLMGDGPKAIRWNGAEAPTINGDRLPDAVNDSEEWYGPYPGESVKGAAVFASKADARPVLNGVAFSGDRIAATDSYRLAVERVIGGRMPEDTLVVPARPLAAIGGKVDAVMIGVRDREVKVYGDLPTGKNRPSIGVEWCGTLIEGQFPKYDQLFPDREAYRVEAAFYPERGLAGVKAAVDSLGRRNRLSVLTLNGNMEISTDTPEGVSLPPVEVAGPVRWTDGTPPEPMRLGVDARFLLDAVKYLDDGGAIIYRAVSPLRPMLIERGARNGKGERQVLTMPLRLG